MWHIVWKACNHLYMLCTSCICPTDFAPMKNTFLYFAESPHVTNCWTDLWPLFHVMHLLQSSPLLCANGDYSYKFGWGSSWDISLKACDDFLMLCTCQSFLSPPPLLQLFRNSIVMSKTKNSNEKVMLDALTANESRQCWHKPFLNK